MSITITDLQIDKELDREAIGIVAATIATGRAIASMAAMVDGAVRRITAASLHTAPE